MTVGLSLGHQVDSLIISHSCLICFGDTVTGMDGASQHIDVKNVFTFLFPSCF